MDSLVLFLQRRCLHGVVGLGPLSVSISKSFPTGPAANPSPGQASGLLKAAAARLSPRGKSAEELPSSSSSASPPALPVAPPSGAFAPLHPLLGPSYLSSAAAAAAAAVFLQTPLLPPTSHWLYSHLYGSGLVTPLARPLTTPTAAAAAAAAAAAVAVSSRPPEIALERTNEAHTGTGEQKERRKSSSPTPEKVEAVTETKQGTRQSDVWRPY